MIGVTTALRKISKIKKRIKVIRGGQGASKTFSILQLLVNHASSKENKYIIICSQELTKLKATAVKDFLNILKLTNLYNSNQWNKTSSEYTFQNNSVIKFIGLDKDDIGKGLRSDVVFFNEANKINFDSYIQLASRTRLVFIDYNPDAECWIETEILNNEEEKENAELLVLTYKDNEYISEHEKKSIESYYLKGYNNDGTVKNEYWANYYRVYACGQIGSLKGLVYNNFIIGKFPDNTYEGKLEYGYGLDFGSDDPDAFVKVAIDKLNKKIFIKELIYQNNLSTSQLVSKIKETHDMPNTQIIADSAGRRTIDDIRHGGIRNIEKSEKDEIVEDIKLIQDYQIIIDTYSTNLQKEIKNYIWKNGKPHGQDHLLDAMKYICTSIIRVKKRKIHKVIR